MSKLTALFICCGFCLSGFSSQFGTVEEQLDARSAASGRVIGKPFSAVAVIHTVQTLVNGAHIDRLVRRRIYQDDQGRYAQVSDAPKKAMAIMDPVDLVNYEVDVQSRTIRKYPLKPPANGGGRLASGDVSVAEGARRLARHMPNMTVEDLGTKLINGVTAQGVRTTTTIPVGAIGNDRELRTVSERWFSNDIHALIRSVTLDPRLGDTTYELTEIVRASPDPSLFQPPAGYTVTTLDSTGRSWVPIAK